MVVEADGAAAVDTPPTEEAVKYSFADSSDFPAVPFTSFFMLSII